MRDYFLIPLVIALVIVTSFVLAGIGEPQSLWLWRDILGVIQ